MSRGKGARGKGQRAAGERDTSGKARERNTPPYVMFPSVIHPSSLHVCSPGQELLTHVATSACINTAQQYSLRETKPGPGPSKHPRSS